MLIHTYAEILGASPPFDCFQQILKPASCPPFPQQTHHYKQYDDYGTHIFL